MCSNTSKQSYFPECSCLPCSVSRATLSADSFSGCLVLSHMWRTIVAVPWEWLLIERDHPLNGSRSVLLKDPCKLKVCECVTALTRRCRFEGFPIGWIKGTRGRIMKGRRAKK